MVLEVGAYSGKGNGLPASRAIQFHTAKIALKVFTRKFNATCHCLISSLIGESPTFTPPLTNQFRQLLQDNNNGDFSCSCVRGSYLSCSKAPLMPSSSSQTTFLSLPPGIRKIIYELILPLEQTFQVTETFYSWLRRNLRCG